MDQSKKTMRHFYCRDVFWETFEQMASDFDCSVDYLVNEAMRHYARSKNYQSAMAPGAVAAPKPAPAVQPYGAPAAAPQAAMGVGPAASPDPYGGYAPQGPPPPQAQMGPPPGMEVPLRNPPPPPMGGPGRGHAQASEPAPPAAAASATLYLVYNSQRYPIAKDQFIIGRGSKTSDLPIKDGNISRKHAAVIRRNGTYYIKDLGSTNGIDYKGMRIDNKRIDEGDLFHICDYELRFTYVAE